MKFKFKPVLTFDEYKKAANCFWYKTNWLSRMLKQRFLEKYGEQYIVDYSFAINGFWGQRKQMDFRAENKNSHSDVEKYFHEIMKDQKEISDYRIHSISVA